MEADGEMRQITDLSELDEQIDLWQNKVSQPQKPIGFILSLEGADSIVDVSLC